MKKMNIGGELIESPSTLTEALNASRFDTAIKELDQSSLVVAERNGEYVIEHHVKSNDPRANFYSYSYDTLDAVLEELGDDAQRIMELLGFA